MKVAILHDYFNKRGGGEMLVLNLAKALGADIYTGFVDGKNTYEEIRNFNVTEIGKNIKNGGLRTIYLMKKFSKLKLIGYDVHIFSGTNCITAVDNNRPNILYCHTPPRYLYDLREWFDKSTGFFRRLSLRLLRWYAYPRDQRCMRRFDKIVVNSENVRKRLLRYYGRDVYEKADVVYSIVDVKKFIFRQPENFYLSIGRLDEFKRVDVIVEAFKRMDKKLVVISSGPDIEKIKKLAMGCKNIKILGWVSEAEKVDLLSRCIATIYVPIDEDMGLTALESFAAGKPCIAANEGGLKELVTNNKTGILIEPTVDGIVAAVNSMTLKKAVSMKNNCLRKANMFTERIFVSKIKKCIKEISEL